MKVLIYILGVLDIILWLATFIVLSVSVGTYNTNMEMKGKVLMSFSFLLAFLVTFLCLFTA